MQGEARSGQNEGPGGVTLEIGPQGESKGVNRSGRHEATRSETCQ